MDTVLTSPTEWATTEAHEAARAIAQLSTLVEPMVAIAEACSHSLTQGGRIFFCGNGGSAADSQHLAAELAGRQNFDRRPLSGIALTTDTSALTAIGNDYGYEQVFARQLRALSHPGDVVVGISTSGKSANVLEAFRVAEEIGVLRVAFTGASASPMSEMAEHTLFAPAQLTPHIQQCHITAGHIICGLIERTLCAPK